MNKHDDLSPSKPKEEKPLKERVEEAVEADLGYEQETYNRLVRVERMLEYLVIARITNDQKLLPEPNIKDIVREIAAREKGKKDDVTPERARKLAWTGVVLAIGPEVTEVGVGDKVYLPWHYSVDTWLDDKHVLFYLEEELLAKEVEE